MKISQMRQQLVKGRKERIEELCDRDLDDMWNSLKAIALCAQDYAHRIKAIQIMLDFAVGKPESMGLGAQLGLRQGVDVRRLTAQEFEAAKTLHAAQERQELEDQGILTEPLKPLAKLPEK